MASVALLNAVLPSDSTPVTTVTEGTSADDIAAEIAKVSAAQEELAAEELRVSGDLLRHREENPWSDDTIVNAPIAAAEVANPASGGSTPDEQVQINSREI